MSEKKFKIIDKTLQYGDQVLGNPSLIHADYNELVGLSEESGVAHHTMPQRVDMVFVAGSVVCGVESKRPEDLLNSFLNRRLKRQLRTLLATVDLPVLLIRGFFPDYILTYNKEQKPVYWTHYPTHIFNALYQQSMSPLFEELTRWQMLGGVVVNGPESDRDVPEFINGMRKVLSGGRNVLVAVAGTDKGKEKERRPGWLLRRIPGIGGKTSQLLHEAAGSTAAVLKGSEVKLKKWGANKKQVKAIEEAME